ncbi:MAG: hypothetical protein ACYSPI_00680, partial [Planctomycetota bacterium]
VFSFGSPTFLVFLATLYVSFSIVCNPLFGAQGKNKKILTFFKTVPKPSFHVSLYIKTALSRPVKNYSETFLFSLFLAP